MEIYTNGGYYYTTCKRKWVNASHCYRYVKPVDLIKKY